MEPEEDKGFFLGGGGVQWALMPRSLPSKAAVPSRGADLSHLGLSCIPRRSPATAWRLRALSSEWSSGCSQGKPEGLSSEASLDFNSQKTRVQDR